MKKTHAFFTGLLITSLSIISLTNPFLTSQAIPLADQCGNGMIEGIEECDDNNLTSNDGCSSSCTLEISCEEPILHGIDDNGSDDSQYITFDSSDDATTIINEVDNADIEAMDHHPSTGVLYAFTGDQNDSQKLLIIIDPISGIPDLLVGIPLQIPSDDEDEDEDDDDWEVQAASFHPLSKELWITIDNETLHTIDLNTGKMTLKKNLNEEPEAIAWNEEGSLLYMEYDDDIYSYNHNTNTLTEICDDIDGIESMEFDPNGNLVIGFNNANNASNTAVYDLNTCSRAEDYVYDVPNPHDDIETLSFSCPDL